MHSTIDTTAHSRPLNTLGHCIMRNLNEKHPNRPGFELRTPEFRTKTGPNGPWGVDMWNHSLYHYLEKNIQEHPKLLKSVWTGFFMSNILILDTYKIQY